MDRFAEQSLRPSSIPAWRSECRATGCVRETTYHAHQLPVFGDWRAVTSMPFISMKRPALNGARDVEAHDIIAILLHVHRVTQPLAESDPSKIDAAERRSFEIHVGRPVRTARVAAARVEVGDVLPAIVEIRSLDATGDGRRRARERCGCGRRNGGANGHATRVRGEQITDSKQDWEPTAEEQGNTHHRCYPPPPQFSGHR